jgi:hypothetical protein
MSWGRALRGAPCTSKPNSKHPCSPAHLACVMGYRSWRLDWEMQYDNAAGIYGESSEEARDFRDRYPPPTFRVWLKNGLQDG